MNVIQPAKPEDFKAVRDLLAANGLVHEDLAPAHLATFHVIPAEEDPSVLAAVVGLESFQGSLDGLLRSLAVSPTLRNRGFGSNLVTAVEAGARALGITRLWLLTTTAPNFFRRFGYTASARLEAPEAIQQSSEFKSLCPASAFCLSKFL